MPDDARAAGDFSDAEVIEKAPPLIRAGRDDFARLYDAEALMWEGRDFVPLRVLVQMERLLGHADAISDLAAFRIAFRQAAAKGWAKPLFARVLIAGFVLGPDAAPAAGSAEAATYEALGRLATPAGVEVIPDLQASVKPADGYVDPVRLGTQMQLATRRVCQIVIDRRPSGTGFLIGQQVVLTNWHVVRPLYGAGGAPPGTEDLGRLKVVFDLYNRESGDSGRAAPPTEFAVRAIDRFDAAYAEEYDGQTIKIGQTAPWEGEEERLDFALIRVDGLPGLDRGPYHLLPDLWPRENASIHVLQYPGQFALRVASGRFGVCDGRKRRVRHDANTAPGSSGGLCLGFDEQTSSLKPCAMHQASLGAHGGGSARPVANQAIPLAKIVPLVAELARRVDDVPPPLRLAAASGADHGGAPVLGRTAFQRYVVEAQKGDIRIIVVRPAAPPGQSTRCLGKSFSEVLLRSLLAPDMNVFVSLGADRISADAGEVARAIIDHVAPGTAGNDWSRPDGATTTETAWIADTLISGEFAPRLDAAARDRLVWLVIDDLDRVDLPDAGGRRFLDALYQKIASLPKLRIVLIGLTRDLPSFDMSTVRVDRLERPPGESEITAWLNRRFGPGRVVESDLVVSLYRLSNEFAGAPGVATLARTLRRIDPLLPLERGIDEEGGGVG